MYLAFRIPLNRPGVIFALILGVLAAGFVLLIYVTSVEAAPDGSAINLQNSCVAPHSGLISWWPGDGNADDIEDGNPGTLLNGTGFGTGFVTSGSGQGFSFDGVDDRIVVADSPNLDFGTGSFTVDYWLNSPLASGNQVHVIKGGGPFNAGGSGWSIIPGRWPRAQREEAISNAPPPAVARDGTAPSAAVSRGGRRSRAGPGRCA